MKLWRALQHAFEAYERGEVVRVIPMFPNREAPDFWFSLETPEEVGFPKWIRHSVRGQPSTSTNSITLGTSWFWLEWRVEYTHSGETFSLETDADLTLSEREKAKLSLSTKQKTAWDHLQEGFRE